MCELVKSDLKPHTGDSLSFNPGWSLTLLYSHCDSVHRTYFIHRPVCEDGVVELEKGRKLSILSRSWAFWSGTISVEEKQRLKIATDTVEGCNFFTLCCSMLILGLTKCTGSPESGGYMLLFHSTMLQQCSLSLMNMLLYLTIGFHGQMLLYFQNYHSVLYILSNAKNNELNN